MSPDFVWRDTGKSSVQQFRNFNVSQIGRYFSSLRHNPFPSRQNAFCFYISVSSSHTSTTNGNEGCLQALLVDVLFVVSAFSTTRLINWSVLIFFNNQICVLHNILTITERCISMYVVAHVLCKQTKGIIEKYCVEAGMGCVWGGGGKDVHP